MPPSPADQAAALASIRNRYEARAGLMTSGQPSEAQLAAIAAAGWDVVINLGMHDDTRYALPDEAASVAALGMRYVHIPVPFAAPTRQQLDAFFAALREHAQRKVWVHCAANWRVSAFVGLWRVLEQGWPVAPAFDILRAVAHVRWQPDATWQAFIDAQLAGHRDRSVPHHATADASVADMAAYYAKRAAIYERVYHKPERQDELRRIEAWLPHAFAGRRVLEAATGTGWWTPHAARDCASWLATDANDDTLDVARTKPLPRDEHGRDKVTFAVADAYDFEATLHGRTFDAAFAGCWWSHVPLARLRPWIDHLHARLEPGARVVMLDNAFVQTSIHPIHRRDVEGNTYQLRTLDDGTTHEVLKNFPTPGQVVTALGERARDVTWWQPLHYWVVSYTLA